MGKWFGWGRTSIESNDVTPKIYIFIDCGNEQLSNVATGLTWKSCIMADIVPSNKTHINKNELLILDVLPQTC